MATYNSWTWSEPHRRYYYLDAAGNVFWDETKQAEDRKVTPSTPGWAFSASYGRYYKYERAHDGTVIETLWTDPVPPKETEATAGCVAFSEWTWSTQYNCSYKLMYGKENVILKTIWETGSPDQVKMLIQSLKRDVCFDDKQGNAGKGHYVTMK